MPQEDNRFIHAIKCASSDRGLRLAPVCRGILRARFQQIANFHEQNVGSGRHRRRARFLRFPANQPRYGLAEPEDDEGDDHEVDYRVDEKPDVQRRRAGLLRRVEGRVFLAVQGEKHIAEIDAADDDPDQRIDYIP
jgi:hypothetical protein